MDAIYFFDSHGALYCTCDADRPSATAFGPTGTARHVSDDEAASQFGLDIHTPIGGDACDEHGNVSWERRTAFAAASAAGRIDFGEEGDFPVLTFPAPALSIHGAAVADSE